MDICTKTIYDGNGNVIATIDPLEKITVGTYYDALNRPYMVIQNVADVTFIRDAQPEVLMYW